MEIHIQPYPTMDEVLRLFAEKPKKPMFKPPRDLYSRNFRDYLTMDGRQAFGDLSSFVLRLATLAHGGCEGCEDMTVAEIIDNLRAIVRGEETGD